MKFLKMYEKMKNENFPKNKNLIFSKNKKNKKNKKMKILQKIKKKKI